MKQITNIFGRWEFCLETTSDGVNVLYRINLCTAVVLLIETSSVALRSVEYLGEKVKYCSIKKSCFDKFRNIHRKILAVESLKSCVGVWRIGGTFSKRDFSTGVFLWILRNFSEHLFWETPTKGCFCIAIFFEQ